MIGKTAAPPAAAIVAAPPQDGAAAADAPWGFYRDRQGRVMQVSFDFGRRLWLGVGYAPRRTPDRRYRDLAGGVRLRRHLRQAVGGRPHAPALHACSTGRCGCTRSGSTSTGFRYDLSHRYQHPLLRITTFVREPARHDLYLNVGLYTEALHFEVAPRGIEGEQSLTLATAQATLDLWQSEDLRSYVRLRVGPGIEMRIGPWGDETRYVGILPQATLEGNIILGQRAMQRLNFRLRGDLLRSATWQAQPLPGDWTATADAAYEAILHGDQRSAGVAAPRRQRVSARRRAADRGGDPDGAGLGLDRNRRHPHGVLLAAGSRRRSGSSGIGDARPRRAAVLLLLLLLAATGRAAAAADADVAARRRRSGSPTRAARASGSASIRASA